MNTYAYSILQYVPDPVRGERINVGVLVAAEAGDYFGAKLIHRREFGRIKRLGYGLDLEFLTEFDDQLRRDSFEAAQIPGTAGNVWGVDALAAASREWANTMQLTPPRPVLSEKAPELLTDLYRRFVAPPAPPRTRARDRRWINRRVSTKLRALLRAQRPDLDATRHVKSDVTIQGGLQLHRFDIQLANGRPIDVVRSLSFETGDKQGLQTEIDAVAWAIDDLKSAEHAPPVTVVSIGGGKQLETAASVYEKLGATFVREREIDGWVQDSSSRLLISLSSTAGVGSS
jgi:hypothetical protein